ncbi:hypothetical protein GKZ89_16340 [Bacillus mangrovi]|uniref:Uncharacterized protein n=1 Tax=Metabacillus mangrovi TaxID=1491830 RepID=A0A7X2V6D5_9BACI|nr:hypothetical protein [Metabacillus mangrovi]MTH54973.1 hypothetical protein [Metabacillus mangrovi]
MLEYCEENPSSTVSLYPYIVSDYPEETDLIFRHYIKAHTARANNRSGYRQAARLFALYADACGEEKALQLKHDLLAEYPNRPAVVDEFGKM